MKASKIRRALIGGACTLGLGLTGAVALTTPAAAISDWIWVCNFYSSVDHVLAYYPNVPNPTIIQDVPQDACGQITDFGNARVDVDIGGTGGDVDSWRKRKNNQWDEWQAWGPCYNNEMEDSNPYSEFTGQRTQYVTYDHTGCA